MYIYRFYCQTEHCSLCMIKTTQFRKKVFTGEFPMHRFQPQTIYTPIRYWLHRFIVFLPTISFESVGCFKIKRMIFQRDKTPGFSLYYILTPAYSRGIVTRNLIFKLRDPRGFFRKKDKQNFQQEKKRLAFKHLSKHGSSSSLLK